MSLLQKVNNSSSKLFNADKFGEEVLFSSPTITEAIPVNGMFESVGMQIDTQTGEYIVGSSTTVVFNTSDLIRELEVIPASKNENQKWVLTIQGNKYSISFNAEDVSLGVVSYDLTKMEASI